jgi:agmatine/peptidylarginine deiminase
LKESLGFNRVLWISEGHIAGDDTDGHIDTLARFCDSGTIAYSACDNPSDPHWPSLKGLENQLRNLRTISGMPYRLVPLPLPAPVLDTSGRRLPANYANFLIINGAVMVPAYGDAKADTLAQKRIAEAFPDREIIVINCTALVAQNGSLHCMSMQVPEGVKL